MTRARTMKPALVATVAGIVTCGTSQADVPLALGPMDRIVVTARRTSQPSLTAPLSLNVLESDHIAAGQIRSTYDLQFATPGLITTVNTAFGQLYLRGVGGDLISVGGDATVATFVDGVYQARAAGSLQDVFDVARIEILKGPQGALYGRNTTAGAIHIVTERPAMEPEAKASVAFGNYRQRRVTGVINGPVAPDVAALRLSVMTADHDGFAFNAARSERTDADDVNALRLQALLNPAEAMEVVVRADVSDNDSSRFLAQKPVAPFTDNPALALAGAPSPDPRVVALDAAPRSNLRSTGASVDATWRTADGAIRSLTAWRDVKLDQLIDLDATRLPFATAADVERSRVFTQDLQWSTGGDGWSMLFGGSYLHENARQALDIFAPALRSRDQPSATVIGESWAAFAQGQWSFAHDWSVTFAARASHDSKRERFRQVLNLAPAAAFTARASWDSFSPEATLDYRIAPDWLFYVSAKRGFKAGGFNANQAQPAPFAPERLWAYEAGAKGEVSERATVAVAAFHYDYRNIQVTRIVPNATGAGTLITVENAAAATIDGAEVSATVAPAEGIDIDGALAYLDATYDRYTTINPSDPTQNPNRAGNPLPKAPKWTFNLGATLSADIGRGLRVSTRAEYRRQSGMFLNAFRDPLIRQDAYSLINARAALSFQDGAWTIAAFGKNLGNTLFAAGASRVRGQTGNVRVWAPPRTYGVDVGFTY